MAWSDWAKAARRSCAVGAATLAIASCGGDDFAKEKLVEGRCPERDCTAECSDDTDNDGDNRIDCQDPDCSAICADASTGGAAGASPPGSGGADPGPSIGGHPVPLDPDDGSPPVTGGTGGSGGALGATGALYGIPLDPNGTGALGPTGPTGGSPPGATGAV